MIDYIKAIDEIAKKYLGEATQNSDIDYTHRAEGEVPFNETSPSDPYIQTIIEKFAESQNKSKEEAEEIFMQMYNEKQEYYAKSPLLYGTMSKNIAEEIAFEFIGHIDMPEIEFDQSIADKLFNIVKGRNAELFPLSNVFEPKRKRPELFFVPSRLYPQYNSVDTAACTPDAKLLFNIPFMTKLMKFAVMKGLKAKPGFKGSQKYVSQGGEIPDEYVYFEFVLMHEIMHFADGHFFLTNFYDLNPRIVNLAGDFDMNYRMVKSGMHQLPMGLFNDGINFDRQNTFVEMHDIIQDELKRLKDEADDMLDDLESKGDNMPGGKNDPMTSEYDMPEPEGSQAPKKKRKATPEEEAEMAAKNKCFNDCIEQNGTDPESVKKCGEQCFGAPEEGGDGKQPPGGGSDEDVEYDTKPAWQPVPKNPPPSGGGGQGDSNDQDQDQQDGDGDGGESGDNQDQQDGDGGESGSKNQRAEDYKNKEEGQGGSGNSGDQDAEQKDGQGSEAGDQDGKQQSGSSAGGEEEEASNGQMGKDREYTGKPKKDKAPSMEDFEKARRKNQEAFENTLSDEAAQAAQQAAQDQMAPGAIADMMSGSNNGGNGDSLDNNPYAVAEKTYKPKFNWKKMIANMVPNGKKKAETFAKPSRRTVSSMVTVSQTGAGVVKPGMKEEDDDQKGICFILDNSGSTMDAIGPMQNDIMTVIKKEAAKLNNEMYVMKFSNDVHYFKVDIKKKKYGRITDVEEYLATGKSKIVPDQALSGLFKTTYGGGTELKPEIVNAVKSMIRKKFNVILFSDSDISDGYNGQQLKEIYALGGPKNQIGLIGCTKSDFKSYIDLLGDKASKHATYMIDR